MTNCITPLQAHYNLQGVQITKNALYKPQSCVTLPVFIVVQNVYKPQRRYRKPLTSKKVDEETKVHSTLLEYGRSVLILEGNVTVR